MGIRLIGALPGVGLLIASAIAASWLGGWCGAMTAVAGWFLVPQFSAVRRQRPSPFLGWVTVLVTAILGAAGTVILTAGRQQADALDMVGVYILNGRAPVTAGVGMPRLDVRLEGAARDFDHWGIRLTPTDSGYRIEKLEGVDWIEHWRGKSSNAVLAIGARLNKANRSVQIRGEDGVAHTLILRAMNSRGAIELDGVTFPLSSSSEVGDERILAALRAGMSLSDLVAPSTAVPLVASCIRVALATEGTPLPGPWNIWLSWPEVNVGALSPTCSIGQPGTVEATNVPRGDTLRVVSDGRAWRFVVDDELGPGGRIGVQVRFSRRPRPRIASLPGADVCEAASACGVVSTHPLPPPVAWLNVGRVGLDTSRYHLLGRVDGSEFVTLGRRIVLRPNEETRLPFAHPAGTQDAGATIRLRKLSASGLLPRVFEVLGLGLLWLCTGLAMRRVPAARSTMWSGDINAALGWAVLYITTMLAGVRLGLGMRTSLAEPFGERGIETAIGLWLAIPLMLIALALILQVPALVARRGARHGQAAAPDRGAPSTDRHSWSLGPEGWIVLVIVACLAYVEWRALQGAVTVTIALSLCWLAAVGAQAFMLSTSQPLQALFSVRRDGLERRESARLLVLVFLAVLVISKKSTIVPVALCALIWVIVTASRLWRVRQLAAPDSRLHRGDLIAALLNGLCILGLVALTWLFEGPFALFAALFVTYLAAVRAGILFNAWTAASEPAERRLRDQPTRLLILLAPTAALIFIALADFGLALVAAVPVVVTTLLAANAWALPRVGRVAIAGALVLVVVGVRPVLFPSSANLRAANSAQGIDREFASLGGPAATIATAIGKERPLARAIVRSLAARDPGSLEPVLVASRPSIARDEILRSLEQAWGGKVYSAAGLGGVGTARAPFDNVGIPRATAYAENAFAAFVMAEHGWLGALGVIAILLMLVLSGLCWIVLIPHAQSDDDEDRARIALVVGGVLWLVVPTVYVALGNLGVVPLTGQNMPFLGLNSWADVLFSTGVASTLFVASLTRTDRG